MFFIGCVISGETEQFCYSEKFDKHGSVPLASQVLANTCAVCWSIACNKGEPNTRWLWDLVMTSEAETCQLSTGSLAEMPPLTLLSLRVVSLPGTFRYTVHRTDIWKLMERKERTWTFPLFSQITYVKPIAPYKPFMQHFSSKLKKHALN